MLCLLNHMASCVMAPECASQSATSYGPVPSARQAQLGKGPQDVAAACTADAVALAASVQQTEHAVFCNVSTGVNATLPQHATAHHMFLRSTFYSGST